MKYNFAIVINSNIIQPFQERIVIAIVIITVVILVVVVGVVGVVVVVV